MAINFSLTLKDWEQDLAELKSVIGTVKRPDNVKLLEQQLKVLEARIERAKAEQPKVIEVKPQPKLEVRKEAVSQVLSSNYITITKYSYDQEGAKVKIYLPLEDVGKECKEDQVSVVFTRESVEVKIVGYKGQNYTYAIRKLNGPIKPEESKYAIKNNNIIITMIKAQSKHWDGVHYKQDKFKMDTPAKEKDPQAGLMDLMKKMYEQGDDNMKRTIAETWSKSQNKTN